MATHFDAMALQQRKDLLNQDVAARADLQKHGMAINDTDSGQFRDVLRKGGYYATFRAKYGKEAWSLLEKYAGQLA